MKYVLTEGEVSKAIIEYIGNNNPTLIGKRIRSINMKVKGTKILEVAVELESKKVLNRHTLLHE